MCLFLLHRPSSIPMEILHMWEANVQPCSGMNSTNKSFKRLWGQVAGSDATCIRTGMVAFLGVILTAITIAAMLLTHGAVKPIGRISPDDVLVIQDLVKRDNAARWSWFTCSNLRSWPRFIRERMTFRIVDMKEDSIETVYMHPNGSAEHHRPVTVWFSSSGQAMNTCRVEKRNGGWMIAPHVQETPLMLFLPCTTNKSEKSRVKVLSEYRDALAGMGPFKIGNNG